MRNTTKLAIAFAAGCVAMLLIGAAPKPDGWGWEWASFNKGKYSITPYGRNEITGTDIQVFSDDEACSYYIVTTKTGVAITPKLDKVGHQVCIGGDIERTIKGLN